MSTHPLLAECHARGLRLRVDGDSIEVEGPKAALSPALVKELKRHKPELMQELVGRSQLNSFLAKACNGIDGITPDQLRVLLSPDDTSDILADDISEKCLRGYAKSFAEGIQSGRILFHPKSGALVRHGLA